jgi:hypothetical protein
MFVFSRIGGVMVSVLVRKIVSSSPGRVSTMERQYGWQKEQEWAASISWREHVTYQWDDDEVRFVLDQRAELDFYSARSLKQQCAGRHKANHNTETVQNTNSHVIERAVNCHILPDFFLNVFQAFNHSYTRGSHCNHSPRNVPSLPYTYLGAANPNYQMYPGHKMVCT